ncbi:MAG: NUDIX domain-containing protein, partial [Nitrospiraceae bacterium]|nr:NUDIX domain-containing protein [Nitrospiraceae bacterium]
MSEGTYTYDYPRPMLTVDAVVFAVRDGGLNVLLIQRGQEPWKGMWAIPGGFIDMDEELDAAARRELEEETGVTGVPLVQYHTFGGVGR